MISSVIHFGDCLKTEIHNLIKLVDLSITNYILQLSKSNQKTVKNVSDISTTSEKTNDMWNSVIINVKDEFYDIPL